MCENYQQCTKTHTVFSLKSRYSEARFSNGDIRHGLVDGLHTITHGKFIDNLLRGLLKVNLPCIIPFGIRDLHHTVVLNICHIVEEVLQRGKCEGVREAIEEDTQKEALERVTGKAEEKAKKNKKTKRQNYRDFRFKKEQLRNGF